MHVQVRANRTENMRSSRSDLSRATSGADRGGTVKLAAVTPFAQDD